MKQFLVVLASLLLLVAGAASPVATAQRRDCSLEVTPKVEAGHTTYEISGELFSAGEQVRIEAVNRRTDQGYVFFLTPTTASFSGIFVGKDADGFFYRVAPGSWRVEAKGGGCKAKADFAVTGLPNGVWGGEQVQEPNDSRPARLETFNEGAKLEGVCNSGSIDAPLLPDENGKFEAMGVLLVQAGPTFTFRARYTGQTDGNTMMITVTVDDNSAIKLRFNLSLGQQVDIPPCRLR